MAFTYSDNPSSTGTAAQKRDAVRFLIQDTDTTNGKVTDAQIAWALGEEPNVYGAAARCCEALANKHGNISSRSVGDSSGLAGASGAITVPISRPSITAPGSRRAKARWKSRNTSRTGV
jgi:hypothetical protein